MIWSITFDPMLPLPLLVVAAVIGMAIVAILAFKRMHGAILRALAIAALLAALANPAVLREDREPLKSVVAVVVDGSQSQTMTGRVTKTEQARRSILSQLKKLPGLDVRQIDVTPTSQDSALEGTALVTALSDGLADVEPDRFAGAILLTDGQIHDVPSNPKTFGFDAPLHALITGKENERDRRLLIERAPRFGLVDTEQTVSLKVVDQGPAGAGNRVQILVRRDGETLTRVRVVAGSTVKIPVQVTHGGSNIFEFEASPLEGELTEVNNRAVVPIQGIRENLRVLLVSGEPHAGERTWRNLLKSDAAVDLVHFTILRPPEKQDGTPINQLSLIAFPTRELFSVKIKEFDLIIFDRYRRRGVLPILYFDNIARYVRDGGAVLVASGPDYADSGSLYRTPLGAILPAEPTGKVLEKPYHARVTDIGNRHPVTRKLPGAAQDPPGWSRWFRQVDVTSAKGQTVLNGADDKPLLVLNREEKGRVALLLSDHAWLWARGYEGGGPHVPLLRRLAHWLMKETDLEEETLRVRAQGDTLRVERQTLTESVDPVTVTLPSGETRRLILKKAGPGLWQATTKVDQFGLFSATDGSHRALAHLGPSNPKEVADLTSTTKLLAPFVDTNGGSVRRLAAGGDPQIPRIIPMKGAKTYHGSGWIGLRTSGASVLKGIDRYPLMAGLLGLAVLLGLMSAMWYREGR